MSRRALVGGVAAWLLAVLMAGCSYTYDVTLVNRSAAPVIVELTQFHSEGFDGQRPAALTVELMVGERQVEVAPNARVTTRFSDATGGFWVRWRRVGPGPPEAGGEVIALARDGVEVVVAE